MDFPTITIPCPDAVKKWAASQIKSGTTQACFGDYIGWQISNIDQARRSEMCLMGYGPTPEEALENLKAKIEKHDPLSEARRIAEAAGFTLTPKS